MRDKAADDLAISRSLAPVEGRNQKGQSIGHRATTIMDQYSDIR